MQGDRGVLTLATGPPRYLDMAVGLAQSLRRHEPHVPLAVATDSDDRRLAALYDHVVRIERGAPAGLHGKLQLDRLSPFEQTLFIDGDCLVVRPLDEVFELFSGEEFGVIGHLVHRGEWFMDIADALRRIERPALPKFNGGVYWFTRAPRAEEVFATARRISDRYEQYGLRPFRGGIAEEPVYALALALLGVAPLEDGGRAMQTPIYMRGWLHLDVLEGRCRFRKGDALVSPAIVHFAGAWGAATDPRSAFYRRERLKLELASDGHASPSWAANLRYAVPCAAGCLAVNAYETLRDLRARARGQRAGRFT